MKMFVLLIGIVLLALIVALFTAALDGGSFVDTYDEDLQKEEEMFDEWYDKYTKQN